MRAASHISLFHTAGATRAGGGVHNSIAARRRRRQRLLYGTASGGTVGVSGERTDVMNIKEPSDQMDEHSDLLSDSRSSDEEHTEKHVKKRFHSRRRSPSLPMKSEDHSSGECLPRRTSPAPVKATDPSKRPQRCVRLEGEEQNEEQGGRNNTLAPAPFDPYKHIFSLHTSLSSTSMHAEESETQANNQGRPQPYSPYSYPPSRGRVRGLFIATSFRERGREEERAGAAMNSLIDCLCRLKLPLREVCVLSPSDTCRDEERMRRKVESVNNDGRRETEHNFESRRESLQKGREDGVVTDGSDTDASEDRFSAREHDVEGSPRRRRTGLSENAKPSSEQRKVPCEGLPSLAPTRANIVAHLRWLAKDSAAGDVLILHLTGVCFLPQRDTCDEVEASSPPKCCFSSSCFATSSGYLDGAGENTCRESDSLITGSEILAVLAEEMRASGRGSARLIAIVDCVFAPLPNSYDSRLVCQSIHQERNMHRVLPLPLEFTFQEGRKHTYPQEDDECERHELPPLSDLDIIMYSNYFDSKCGETNVHHHEHKHHHDDRGCTAEEEGKEVCTARGVEARTSVSRLTQDLCRSLLSTTALSYEDLLNDMCSNAQAQRELSAAVAPLSVGSGGNSTCFALSSSRKIKVTEPFSFFGSRKN